MAGTPSSASVTVTTPGTAVALGDSSDALQVFIQALSTNAGLVVVGDSNVKAAAVGRRGISLTAGQVLPVPIMDTRLSKWFVDALNAADGVSIVYLLEGK